MRKTIFAITLICYALICTGCGGKVIFQKPGATEVDFEQDKTQCEFEATKYSYTPMGAFDSPFMSGAQEGLRYNKLMMMCLQAKGWRPIQQ